MSKENPAPPSVSPPFDLGRFKELVALMEEHGLTEVDLQHGEQRWKVRRGPPEGTQLMQSPASYPANYPGGYSMMPMPVASAPSPAAPQPPTSDAGIPIKSPTVGSFYSASGPGEEPFIKVGSKVNKDTVVCIIEAMKVMNHITADVEGTITEVLVKNGDAVEFNQPMFRVKVG